MTTCQQCAVWGLSVKEITFDTDKDALKHAIIAHPSRVLEVLSTQQPHVGRLILGYALRDRNKDA